jgi:hypothetical protein
VWSAHNEQTFPEPFHLGLDPGPTRKLNILRLKAAVTIRDQTFIFLCIRDRARSELRSGLLNVDVNRLIMKPVELSRVNPKFFSIIPRLKESRADFTIPLAGLRVEDSDPEVNFLTYLWDAWIDPEENVSDMTTLSSCHDLGSDPNSLASQGISQSLVIRDRGTSSPFVRFGTNVERAVTIATTLFATPSKNTMCK